MTVERIEEEIKKVKDIEEHKVNHECEPRIRLCLDVTKTKSNKNIAEIEERH